MRGKPTSGRRIQMLHDLANDGGFVALKRAAEDREGWRHRERMSKTCWRLLMMINKTGGPKCHVHTLLISSYSAVYKWLNDKWLLFKTRLALSMVHISTKAQQHPLIQAIPSLHFTGHFPGEPGLAGVYWSKGWWRWQRQLDYWSYKLCKAPIKSSPPINQHPVFSLPVAQPTVSKQIQSTPIQIQIHNAKKC